MPILTWILNLTQEQLLDVLASVETMRDIHKDPDTRGRLTALLDNIAAQTGSTRSPD